MLANVPFQCIWAEGLYYYDHTSLAFHFFNFFETPDRKLTKLDKNTASHVWVSFKKTDPLTKMAALASDLLRHFGLLLCNCWTKLDGKQEMTLDAYYHTQKLLIILIGWFFLALCHIQQYFSYIVKAQEIGNKCNDQLKHGLLHFILYLYENKIVLDNVYIYLYLALKLLLRSIFIVT